jgi:hypothetical protein
MDAGLMTMTRKKRIGKKIASEARFARSKDSSKPNTEQADDTRPSTADILDMSPLELRLDGLVREFMLWPHGPKTPPFLSTLLPDALFPAVREPAKDQERIIKRVKERAPKPAFQESAVPELFLPLDRNESPFPAEPIKPLFPPPGNFHSDPARYIRPDNLYSPRKETKIPQAMIDALALLFNGGAATLTTGPVMQARTTQEAPTPAQPTKSSVQTKVQLMNAKAAARQAQREQGRRLTAPDLAGQGKPDTQEVEKMNVSPSYAMDAQGDKRFFCANGQVFANLRDLHAGLLMMKDEHFRHHVSDQKNDFAAWIGGVFGDQVLAAELSQVRSRALTAYKVGQRVRSLKKN